ncbi:hypothetical protein STEG23_024999, partial [Scotinomys teguina]
ASGPYDTADWILKKQSVGKCKFYFFLQHMNRSPSLLFLYHIFAHRNDAYPPDSLRHSVGLWMFPGSPGCEDPDEPLDVFHPCFLRL